MKNNFLFYTILILFGLITISKSYGDDQFNFDVTNVEILENGTLFKGSNKGVVTSENGVIINADNFEYNKTQKSN